MNWNIEHVKIFYQFFKSVLFKHDRFIERELSYESLLYRLRTIGLSIARNAYTRLWYFFDLN